MQNTAKKRAASGRLGLTGFSKIGAVFCCVVTAAGLTACGSESGGDKKSVPETVAAKVDSLDSASKCGDIAKLISKRASKNLTDFQRYKLDAGQNICSLDFKPEITPEISETLKKDGVWAKIENGELLVYGRSANAGEAPQLCCSIQNANWAQLSEDEWGAKFKLAKADEARLMFMDLSGTSRSRTEFQIFGENAKQTEIPFLNDPKEKITGRLSVRQKFSPELEETRLYSIYKPSVEFGKDAALLIFADGKALEFYSRMVDPMISSGQIKPVIMVGLWSGNRAIREPKNPLPDDARAADYLKGADEDYPERFSNHMDFVFKTLLPDLKKEFETDYDISGLAVVGHSNGAVFATRAGLEHPDEIDSVLAVSQGFRGITDELEAPKSSPRFYLSAGLYEPAFMASTEVTRDTLKSQGYDVSAEFAAVGHDPGFYQLKLFEFLMFEYGLNF